MAGALGRGEGVARKDSLRLRLGCVAVTACVCDQYTMGNSAAALRLRRGPTMGHYGLGSMHQRLDDGGCVPDEAYGYVWRVDGKASPDVIFVMPTPR